MLMVVSEGWEIQALLSDTPGSSHLNAYEPNLPLKNPVPALDTFSKIVVIAWNGIVSSFCQKIEIIKLRYSGMERHSI
ncbi:hypothetical protein G6L95_06640 [Agrobacterium rhizogenes]|nr:hypothetical protein [Rhizobium rhizogenes]NTI54628.1 hypothetical protein [Rhizobium rhizogenes]